MKDELGLVQVYTGNGKGKTTAALGTALRSVGHGMRAVVIQFLKGGQYTGEVLAVQKAFPKSLIIKQFGKPCTYSEKKKMGKPCGNCRDCFLTQEEEVGWSKKAMAYAKEVATTGKYRIVVLDEVNITVARGLIDKEDVLKLMKKKHKKTDLILTGQRAAPEFIEAADLVTEMRKIKHPISKGIYGRRGVEY